MWLARMFRIVEVSSLPQAASKDRATWGFWGVHTVDWDFSGILVKDGGYGRGHNWRTAKTHSRRVITRTSGAEEGFQRFFHGKRFLK